MSTPSRTYRAIIKSSKREGLTSRIIKKLIRRRQAILNVKKELRTMFPKESEKELRGYFGEPAKEENLKTIISPYRLTLSYDRSVHTNKIRCHKLIADKVERVLSKILDYYGISRIKELGLDIYGGCYNPRLKRGSKKEWSTHAWGIALDFNPDNNKLTWSHKRAKFAQPEYDYWWKCWEEEGFTSLGRTKDYDWMHLQATS